MCMAQIYLQCCVGLRVGASISSHLIKHVACHTLIFFISAEYPLLMGLLRHRTHKELATKIIQTIVEGGTKISSVEKVAMLFRFISPLIKDADGGMEAADLDDEDIEEEQVGMIMWLSMMLGGKNLTM